MCQSHCVRNPKLSWAMLHLHSFFICIQQFTLMHFLLNIKASIECMKFMSKRKTQVLNLVFVVIIFYKKKITFKQLFALVASLWSLPLLTFQNICLPPICNSNRKNMQNRPDGVSQPAIPQPIREPFLCLFFCTPFNKYFQNIYKSQDVSDELICTFIELIHN